MKGITFPKVLMPHIVVRQTAAMIAAVFGLLITAGTSAAALDDRSTPPASNASCSIAIPKFAVANSRDADISARVRQAIIDRLSHRQSCMLRDTTKDAQSLHVDRPPEFAAWEARDVKVLIIGNVERMNDKRLKVSVRVWDIPGHRHLYGTMMVASADQCEEVADVVAKEISQRLNEMSATDDRPRPPGAVRP